MTRNLFLSFSLLTLRYAAIGQNKKFIPSFNPTGSYKMGGKHFISHGEPFGYSGFIKVKLIQPGRIVVSLYATKLPNGHDGSFVDTLLYSHHKAVYHHCESDTTCRITFDFTSKGVSVVQTQANLNDGCGFGQGVFADGYYKKVSARVPEIEAEK
jgi:hypothetical protein